MQKYIDLSSLIDVEPELNEVLELVSNEDLIEAVSYRFTKDFARELIQSLYKVDFLTTLKEAILEYDKSHTDK